MRANLDSISLFLNKEEKIVVKEEVSHEKKDWQKGFCVTVWSEACGHPMGLTSLSHVRTVLPNPDNTDNSAPYGPRREGHLPTLHTEFRDCGCILMVLGSFKFVVNVH